MIDIAFLDDGDIEFLAAGAGILPVLLHPLRFHGQRFKQGFAISMARSAAATVRAPGGPSSSSVSSTSLPVAKTPAQPYVSALPKSSSRALLSCVSVATRWWTFPGIEFAGKRKTPPPV